MKFEETRYDDAVAVDSYGPGFFRISGDIVEGSVFLFDGSIRRCTLGAALKEMGDQIEGADVVFIGTGADLCSLSEAELTALKKIDVGYELMATPTACRMYNVLLSEGRKVALIAEAMPS